MSLNFSDNVNKNKLNLPSKFKRKYTQMKKMTTKNHGSELNTQDGKNDAKNLRSTSYDSKTHPNDMVTTHNKDQASSLRPPAPAPAGFLRRLSFRDRRGSSPSPFMSSNVDKIIPISKNYLKVPSSPHSSPTIAPKLG